MRKNRSFLILIGLVAALGGYLAYDLSAEKREEKKQERDLTLFPFPAEHVSDLIIEKNDPAKNDPDQNVAVTHVQRSVDGWKVLAPVSDRADDGATDDFVARVAGSKAVSIIKKSSDGTGADIDWKLYGFDRLLGRVTLKAQSGESRIIAVSEKKDIDQNSFARIEGVPVVYAVDSSWTVNAAKTATDFRDKRLFRGALGALKRLTIRNSGGSFELTHEEGRWVSPTKPDWTLDQNRVREAISMLSETQVSEFVAETPPKSVADRKKYGLAQPSVHLRVDRQDSVWSADLGTADGRDYAAPSEPAYVLRLEPGSVSKFAALRLEDMKKEQESVEKN